MQPGFERQLTQALILPTRFHIHMPSAICGNQPFRDFVGIDSRVYQSSTDCLYNEQNWSCVHTTCDDLQRG